jgi:hypothetical protein
MTCRLTARLNVVSAQPDIRPGVLTPSADLSFLRTTRRIATTATPTAARPPAAP